MQIFILNGYIIKIEIIIFYKLCVIEYMDKMSSIHQDLLSNYEPVKLIQQNIKLLSNVLTKYQDCKFYVVGFELKGCY